MQLWKASNVILPYLPYYPNKLITGTFNKLKQSYNVLHPDEVVEPLTFDFQNDMLMDYVEGYDIINKVNILVPAALALFYLLQTHLLSILLHFTIQMG